MLAAKTGAQVFGHGVRPDAWTPLIGDVASTPSSRAP